MHELTKLSTVDGSKLASYASGNYFSYILVSGTRALLFRNSGFMLINTTNFSTFSSDYSSSITNGDFVNSTHVLLAT